MKNVTAIVISFLRPAYTVACIESLRRTYPEVRIIVGENGVRTRELEDACKAADAKYIQLPYDSGVCVARNELMKHVETEMVLVGDDDFYYDANAKADAMAKLLQAHPELDLVGGRINQDRIVRNFQGTIERYPRHIVYRALDLEHAPYEHDEYSGLRFVPCDLVFNYFVARADKVRAIPWDENIKVVYEHESWFMDAKDAGMRVAFSPEPIVLHKPEHIAMSMHGTPEHHTYMAFRNRRTDKEYFFKKHRIKYFIDMNGNRAEAPDSIREKRKNDTKLVDFCITTFKRPKALERLLFSIAEHYPMANIYVADQNRELDRDFYKKLKSDLYDAGLAKRVIVEHLPYDCGLSYARNHLVNTTPNKYKLILDDDFEFIKETDIGKMVKLLEGDPRAGIVGGRVQQHGEDLHFEFVLEQEGDTIIQKSDDNRWREHEGIRYKRTGCVLNFALMRKELFHYIQWDPELKVTEHTDFYLRMRNVPMHILYAPEVVVGHPPAERTPEYKEHRTRQEFMVKMLQKHRARRIKYLNGQITEIGADGSITRYKEKP